MRHDVLVCSLMLLCHAASRVILHHYVAPSRCVMLWGFLASLVSCCVMSAYGVMNVLILMFCIL